MVKLLTTVPHRNPKRRKLASRIAANSRWAQASPRERQAQAQRMAEGKRAKWAKEIDPDGIMEPAELARQLASRQQAHMLALTLARQQKLTKQARQ